MAAPYYFRVLKKTFKFLVEAVEERGKKKNHHVTEVL
jgi:hypothetical protein